MYAMRVTVDRWGENCEEKEIKANRKKKRKKLRNEKIIQVDVTVKKCEKIYN